MGVMSRETAGALIEAAFAAADEHGAVFSGFRSDGKRVPAAGPAGELCASDKRHGAE